MPREARGRGVVSLEERGMGNIWPGARPGATGKEVLSKGLLTGAPGCKNAQVRDLNTAEEAGRP